MKSATMLALRVDPELRRAADAVLHEHESLSAWIESRAGARSTNVCFPFTCRKVDDASRFLRERVILTGEAGYVALFGSGGRNRRHRDTAGGSGVRRAALTLCHHSGGASSVRSGCPLLPARPY